MEKYRKLFLNCLQIPTLSVFLWLYFNTYCNAVFRCQFLNEPQNDKTNKLTLRPAKTQISLGIHPVWSESPLHSMGAKNPRFLHADSEDWSDWVNAQADLWLCWAHRLFCWFCHATAQMRFCLYNTVMHQNLGNLTNSKLKTSLNSKIGIFSFRVKLLLVGRSGYCGHFKEISFKIFLWNKNNSVLMGFCWIPCPQYPPDLPLKPPNTEH